MKTKRLTRRRVRRVVLSSLASLGLLMAASAVHAASSYENAFSSRYPGSGTNVAGCQICHADSTQNLNPYGKELCDLGGGIDGRMAAVEGADSDGDPTGSNNGTEIGDSAQPGWTTNAVPTYSRSGSCNATGNTETAPNNNWLLDPAPAEEICNDGIDNSGNGLVDCADPQCNGFVDETPTTCSTGVCAATGNLVCQNGVQVDTCEPGAPEGEGPFIDASCRDSVDNNCDGLTDLDDPNCSEPAETCDNGVDDNLNGDTDCQDLQCNGDTFGACDTGSQGICSAGTLTCDGSAIGPVCVQNQAAGTEVCDDGLDNDCDGLTDAADPDCDPDVPAEICDNGADDNGNGLVDCEDPQCDGVTGDACATGLPGICAAGTSVCQNGGQVCEQNDPEGTEGPFGNATCGDVLDNDCDGQTDEADAGCDPVPVPEVCGDGIDNSGNGLVDCADPACDGFVGDACNTGNLGICATGTSVCRELQQFCDQDQQAGNEGPTGDATCSDALDNDCNGLSDARDPNCAVVVGDGDVFLSRLQVPGDARIDTGRTLESAVTARGGSTVRQNATVVLSAVASANLRVTVEPASVTERVRRRRGTDFDFDVFVSCNAAGRGTVDWTAIISAPANDDLSNDVRTATSSVECVGGDEDDEHDDDEHDDDEHDDDEHDDDEHDDD